MKERKIVKLRVDMYEDTKSKIIDRMNERDLIHYIWIRLIALAGKVNLKGELFLSRNIPYTLETLAIEFNREAIQVKLVLEVLIDLEMLEFTEDNIYKVKNFAKHQNIKVNEEVENRDNVEKEKGSDEKEENLKENLMIIDSKTSKYKSIDKIIKNKTSEIKENNIVISREAINNDDYENNSNNFNEYRENPVGINSEFIVRNSMLNEAHINNDNMIRTEKTSDNEIININMNTLNNKNINENNVHSSIPTSLQKKKKNNKSRGKSKDKGNVNEINFNQDEEEIVEFHSGDIPLGEGEKVVMAFSM